MKKNAFLLKINSNDNIKYLESAGYENIQNISFEGLRAKVVVVDEEAKNFMAISVTCLAAMNVKPLNFEEFKVVKDVNNSPNDELGC